MSEQQGTQNILLNEFDKEDKQGSYVRTTVR